jgi:hypothetical protein
MNWRWLYTWPLAAWFWLMLRIADHPDHDDRAT